MRTTARFKLRQKPVIDGGPRDEMEPLRAWLDGPRVRPILPANSLRITPPFERPTLAARLRRLVGL